MPSRLTLRDFALGIALLLICLFFAFTAPQFLSSRNLSLLLIELSITATLALGMLLVILPGHIDLSAGSGVGLAGGVAAVLVSGGDTGVRLFTALKDGMARAFGPNAAEWVPVPPWSPWAAMLFALTLGLLLWWGMGALIVGEGIPAFIITLGGLLIFKGLFWLVIQSHTVAIGAASSAASSISYWLHLGSWEAPVWRMVRAESGYFELSFLAGDRAFPILNGTGNLFSMLTTSYLSRPAGYGLAAFVVLILIVAKLRGRKQRLEDAQEANDGELDFLRLFLAAQLIFLAVIVTNQYRGVPIPALVLTIVAAMVWVLTQHTPFGRYLYAIGGNEEAAVISGVPVRRVSIVAFIIMGGITALTGLMQTAYAGSSTTTIGNLMELDAVAACVIGGVSLKGGRGSVLGVLFGALIMACLLNGMFLSAAKPETQLIARGAVLILAVWLDVRLGKGR